jgi:hypothetical protein
MILFGGVNCWKAEPEKPTGHLCIVSRFRTYLYIQYLAIRGDADRRSSCSELVAQAYERVKSVFVALVMCGCLGRSFGKEKTGTVERTKLN